MEKSTCRLFIQANPGWCKPGNGDTGKGVPEHEGLKRGRFITAIRVEPRVNSRPYALRIETGVFCLPKNKRSRP